MLFSERIRKRQRLWWRDRGSAREWIHRKRESLTIRSAEDPEAAWHCCERWQRVLVNKLNGRTFAARLGCPVPELYWTGRVVSRVPLERLPERFVLKPITGTGARRVFLVNGNDCLTSGQPFHRRELGARLRATFLPVRVRPLLAEELIAGSDGEPSLDYKFYVFGERIGAIEVVDRRLGHERKFSFFTPEWEPRSPILENVGSLGLVSRPVCLAEMTRLALRCGAAWGAFVRVDFYVRDDTCVFGEFSSCPNGGKGMAREADAFLGRLWQEAFPDCE